MRQFIVELTSAKPPRLSLATRINHDLRVDSDDGAELIQAFAERFGVDMSDFEFDKHFGPEGCNPLMYAWSWLFNRKSLRLIPITFADLVEAALNKRWQTPNHAAV